MTDKAKLRKTIKTRLNAITRKEFNAAGIAAARQLLCLPRLNEARSVLVFLSMNDEIDTFPVMEAILKTGKALFIPEIEGEMLVFYRIDQNDLKYCHASAKNIYNGSSIRKPVKNPAFCLNPEDFPVLVLTPGLAFDHNFNRLGRGKGFYDRFFAALDQKDRSYTALGFCMDCQLIDKVPTDSLDKKVDGLFTEKRII